MFDQGVGKIGAVAAFAIYQRDDHMPRDALRSTSETGANVIDREFGPGSCRSAIGQSRP